MSNNPNLQAKTLEEHRQYLYEIVRLKLFFLHLWLDLLAEKPQLLHLMHLPIV